VALEVSNFKCGHDAPIYSVVEEIVECSGTPYFSFKDLDENRPAGSIRIRVETISYFLKRYREDRLREDWIEEQVARKAHAAQAPAPTEDETEQLARAEAA
jgi:predicted nucleotide-binding protein (sugar kinase/HSP70/actin superfamily)